ncbi:Nephrocystin-3-like protein 1 [Colletotrichum chlorophyti]|uniref:Nephrocystin-3-like protein 1 n=1 Tax=Colletotrichum chlorophyti TaxID=708187 RepID=A0A1Q8S485_9PEZI|nr:Nephrocystin-3-like protein 1 [Colletotrichum chlorophyti]
MFSLGEEHPDTLIGMGNLASAFCNQSRWKEAEELEVRVLGTRRRVIGEEHPGTLISMGNLALTYRRQGRCDVAMQLMRDGVGLRRRVFGLDHAETISSSSILADWEDHALNMDESLPEESREGVRDIYS